MISDQRLVLEYADGMMTFRRFSPNASFGQLLSLAEAINSFQADPARRTLLVVAKTF